MTTSVSVYTSRRLIGDALGGAICAREPESRVATIAPPDVQSASTSEIMIVDLDDDAALDTLGELIEAAGGRRPAAIYDVFTQRLAAICFEYGITRLASLEYPVNRAVGIIMGHGASTHATRAHGLSPVERSRVDRLTSRQREILELLGTGLDAADVAARLGVTTHTVSSHLKAAYARLGVQQQAHAVSMLVRARLDDAAT